LGKIPDVTVLLKKLSEKKMNSSMHKALLERFHLDGNTMGFEYIYTQIQNMYDDYF